MRKQMKQILKELLKKYYSLFVKIKTLTKLNQMEHQKYNEPYISAIMGEICDYL